MLLKTLRYETLGGWSQPLPSEPNGSATLVLAFGASGFADHAEPFAEIARALPDALLLGCSTSGEISGAHVHDASISVAVAQFEHTALRRATTKVRSAQDSWAAGARLAQQLRSPGLRAVFVLSDGLHVNGTPLVAGLTQNLPDGVLMSDPQRANRTLQGLHALGVHIAIDDFGTGYSSLAYLKRFPAQTVKIDRSFVKGLPQDRDDAAITQAVIAMADGPGLAVVAEGVEAQEQPEFLRQLGCEQAQGYFIGRPMPAAQLQQRLNGAALLRAA